MLAAIHSGDVSAGFTPAVHYCNIKKKIVLLHFTFYFSSSCRCQECL